VGLAQLVEYLVLLRVCGNSTGIRAVEMYFARNMSPSEIARRLGVTRDTVRGYVLRVLEKAGSHRAAAAGLKLVLPHLGRVRPVVKRSGSTFICELCGYTSTYPSSAPVHVMSSHRDLLKQAVLRVFEVVRSGGARAG
jgi:transposase-like protein